MKKRVPITVENKKTVERKNNFPAGVAYRIPGIAMFFHIAEAADILSRRLCLERRMTFL